MVGTLVVGCAWIRSCEIGVIFDLGSARVFLVPSILETYFYYHKTLSGLYLSNCKV